MGQVFAGHAQHSHWPNPSDSRAHVIARASCGRRPPLWRATADSHRTRDPGKGTPGGRWRRGALVGPQFSACSFAGVRAPADRRATPLFTTLARGPHTVPVATREHPARVAIMKISKFSSL